MATLNHLAEMADLPEDKWPNFAVMPTAVAHAFAISHDEYQVFAALRMAERLQGLAGGKLTGWLGGSNFPADWETHYDLDAGQNPYYELFRELAHAYLETVPGRALVVPA